MRGCGVQQLAVVRPDLVRRLIVASSGPGGVPGTPPSPPEVSQIAGKPENDDADFLFMFFVPATTAV
jgi:pimeloyl-ACP methyl ester carboxylesterase